GQSAASTTNQPAASDEKRAGQNAKAKPTAPSPSPNDSSAADSVSNAAKVLGSQVNDSSQTDDPPPAQSSQKKEPPPFDRPPRGSGSRNDRANQPSQPNAQPAPRADSQRPQQPPVLRRDPDASRNPSSTDSDNEQDRGRGQAPVLRRPTDTTPPAGPSAQRPSTQQSPGKQEDNPDDEVIRLESALVNIPLLVSDRSGRYIPQLSKRDFIVYEDGVEQEIASFTSEEVPFNVVLLLDMSPSVQGSVEDIQDAALAFVRQLRSQDRVMVASFDRHVQYLTNFTSDRRVLESAIRSTYTGSGTSVYDAVYEAVDRKLRNVEGRKALILFSDGEDTTSSHAEYQDAIDIVTESDVLVYGLRYPGTGGNVQINPLPRDWPQIPLPLPWPWPRRRRGPFRLTSLLPNANYATASAAPQWPRRRGGMGNGDFIADVATAGGGAVFDAQQISDLSRLAYQIAEELRHIYMISYYPSNKLSNGGYRSIRVRVRGRDDLAVRHRKGYNAGDANRPTHTD
ncbi:MAG TPA: VWA domain-containing protein, partial [Blastocatellia bacterium]|nr:VWA domain-containing protein [Blastocatellia bacterium]